MDGSDDAIGAALDVQLGLQRAAPDERFRGAVVVRQVEILIERQRMRDREVVGFVATPGVRAMCEQASQHDRCHAKEPQTQRRGVPCSDQRERGTAVPAAGPAVPSGGAKGPEQVRMGVEPILGRFVGVMSNPVLTLPNSA